MGPLKLLVGLGGRFEEDCRGRSPQNYFFEDRQFLGVEWWFRRLNDARQRVLEPFTLVLDRAMLGDFVMLENSVCVEMAGSKRLTFSGV